MAITRDLLDITRIQRTMRVIPYEEAEGATKRFLEESMIQSEVLTDWDSSFAKYIEERKNSKLLFCWYAQGVDVFSGLSLSVEKPYDVGDAILLEGGVEGKVVQINWRSTHLRNSENDVVIIPHSSMAKMRIQNHSAVTARHSGNLSVLVDSRNEPELALEILKQAAMVCPAILEEPAPSVAAIRNPRNAIRKPSTHGREQGHCEKRR